MIKSSRSALKTLSVGELDVRVHLASGNLKLSWHGRSIARDPSAILKPFFETVSAQLDKDHDLELDFREFAFMNSSTLKPILTFVQTASNGARSVNIKYDAKKTWQRLSFNLLQAVSSTWTNVNVQGE